MQGRRNYIARDLDFYDDFSPVYETGNTLEQFQEINSTI
jgi:hypothetical protein